MTALPFRTHTQQENALAPVSQHLRTGGLLAYPTETVYGLGCLLQPGALKRLAELKQGRAAKAFLLLIDAADHVPGLHWTSAAQRLADVFWPGPLTLALRIEGGAYPPQVIGPADTVAVRQTAHPGLRLLLRELGQPVTSTSANWPGQPPAQDAQTVLDLLTALDTTASFLLLDGGVLPPSAPSTLIDCSEPVPRLLRAGAISLEQLKRCVDELRT